MRVVRWVGLIAAVLCAAGCGGTAEPGGGSQSGDREAGGAAALGLQAHPQAVQPIAGAVAPSDAAAGGPTPVGNPNT
jgi:hypothetical protein